VVAFGCHAASNLVVYRNPHFNTTLHSNVKYGEALDRCNTSYSCWNSSSFHTVDLLMDVVVPTTPQSTSPFPAIVLIHGGGYNNGDKGILAKQAQWYAERGFVAFNIDYRQNPDHGNTPAGDLQHLGNWSCCFSCTDCSWCPTFVYPAMRDTKAAVRYVRASSGHFNVDTSRIAAYGDSAGGCSAVALGLSFEADYKGEISQDSDPTLRTTNLKFNSSVAAVVSLWGCDYPGFSLSQRDGVPRYRRGLPPVSMYHGDKDPIIPFVNAQNIAQKYSHTDNKATLNECKGMGHDAWDCMVGTKTIDEDAIEFLARSMDMQIEN
jgi:acetyl esterase/lipase